MHSAWSDCAIYFIMIIMSITGMFMSIAIHFELQTKVFWHYMILVLQYLDSRDVSTHRPFRILDWVRYDRAS